MNIITATELRTKTKWLFDTLEKGEKIYLSYKSKIIAVFIPYRGKKRRVLLR